MIQFIRNPNYKIIKHIDIFGLVVVPRTSLERLPSKVTALSCASEDRSERLHYYLIIIILKYKLLNVMYYIK